MKNVCVLDIGKSNIKLSACNYFGEVLDTVSTPNKTYDGKTWKYHNLKKINIWVLKNLSTLSKKYNLKRFITTGHGLGVVFVGDDCDNNFDGTTLPMIDYEQIVPENVDNAYKELAGDFFVRGGKIVERATQNAKQMFCAAKEHPEIFKNSKWALGVSQYWAWRLSGIAASEITYLGAQSHLWNIINNNWSKIVKNQNWKRLLPPIKKTYARLGKVREKLVKEFKLPKDLLIYVGGHDSSMNFYRYQCAGLKNFCTF